MYSIMGIIDMINEVRPAGKLPFPHLCRACPRLS